MKILILVGHGSRSSSANQEIKDLSKTLAAKANQLYDNVLPAFLELAKPSIPEAIQQSIDKGATEVSILPYFLAKGRHVEVDIPKEIEPKKTQYLDVKIELLDYFGKSKYISDSLLKHVNDSQ